ncbi:MAG: efflux RND transporter permease subunit, partial [Gammaproteobacteria bacterium]|nr:efflux RND transporter permease subunit [Gammaproteobacteria bacterium]
SLDSGASNDVEVRVFGEDLDALRRFAADVRHELWGYPGIHEVFDSHREGKRELKLSITPAGEALGLTLVDLGRQVRQAFYGEEVQRVQRGPEDIRIMLRYPAERRRSLAALDSLRVRTPGGDAVPLATAATVEAGRGYSAIQRVDGKRSILVTGKVNPAFTTSAAVQAALVESGFLDETAAKYPGTSYRAEGLAMQQEAMDSLVPLFMLSMFAIFALLAVPLQSYTQPLVIMSVLPFAFVGAVWGHLLMLPLDAITSMSMASVFGIVAAAGVVVNATLVLMHAVNRLRADGDSLEGALAKACCLRARPILITTVTTFAGVLPLILSKNAQAVSLIPMAVSLAYGVLFSTLAALFVVPAVWLALDDLRGGASRVSGALGDMLGAAPRLAQWMALYPHVQEGVQSREFTDLQLDEEQGLDPETAQIARRGLVRVYYERELDHAQMRAQLAAIAARTPTVDDFAQEARVWAEQRTFQVGVHMLNGTIAPLDAARPITNILDATLGALLVATKAEFAASNGLLQGSRVALLALGSFARREFATGTPLELLLLYDHRRAPEDWGTEPAAWHTRLLQRLMRGVRDLSPEGILFAPAAPYGDRSDTGVTAWSLADLAGHMESAASARALRMLVNARAVEAEAGLGEDFEALRRAALASGRDGASLFAEVRREGEADLGDPWDVRRLAGGLGEVELAADAIKLAAGGRVPTMLAAGLGGTFTTAAREGLLAESAATRMAEAATLWQNIDGFVRMACIGAFDPTSASPEQRQTLAGIGGVDDFDAVPEVIAATAERTAELVREMFARSNRPAS